MKFKLSLLVALASIVILGTTFVSYMLKSDQQHQSVSLNEKPGLEPVQLPSQHQSGPLNEKPGLESVQLPLQNTEVVLSNDPRLETQPAEVENEPLNSDSLEIATRENMVEDSEFVDDVDMPDSIGGREIELTDILFDSGLTDEEIEGLFDAIRAGTEEDLEASEPSNDYPERITIILRLLKQTEMNSKEITAMVQDIFPR